MTLRSIFSGLLGRLTHRQPENANNPQLAAPQKYRLTDETIEFCGMTLHRIEATRDIPRFGVVKGDRGGFVQSCHNLSRSGDCWVADNAKVFGYGGVMGDALVCENAWVFDTGLVGGDARVSGNAHIGGNSQMSHNVEVGSDVFIGGDVWVSGDRKIPERGKVIYAPTIEWEQRTKTRAQILQEIRAARATGQNKESMPSKGQGIPNPTERTKKSRGRRPPPSRTSPPL